MPHIPLKLRKTFHTSRFFNGGCGGSLERFKDVSLSVAVQGGKMSRRIREDETTLMFPEVQKRICSRCGRNEVYQDLKNMDWCEECINQFVMECDE